MKRSDRFYEQIVAPIRERMVRSIWRILRDSDDTEEALQEVFVKILKQMGVISNHPNPTAMILRICINRAIDRLRQRRTKTWPIEEASEVASSDPTPSEILARKELQQELLSAIRRLPPRQAEALIMLAVEGLSYRDIAAAMRCREVTVRVLVFNARRAMRKQFKQRVLPIEREVKEA